MRAELEAILRGYEGGLLTRLEAVSRLCLELWREDVEGLGERLQPWPELLEEFVRCAQTASPQTRWWHLGSGQSSSLSAANLEALRAFAKGAP